jgi:hypothetical protein
MEPALPFYALCASGKQHPQLQSYVATSSVPASAYFNERFHCYAYRTAQGALVNCGGLIEALRARYYPHVNAAQEAAKKRRWRSVKIQGSSATIGKRVDAQLLHCVQMGALPKRPHKWSKALAAHWRAMGHTLQAAQLPVVIMQWNRLTQADMITSDAQGRLWLWETKTGVPVGATRKNGTFALAPFEGVPCTKYAQWQLQLYFTRQALETSAGLQIYEARVIQIYSEKGRAEPIIKVHEQPSWIPRQAREQIEPALKRMRTLDTAAP